MSVTNPPFAASSIPDRFAHVRQRIHEACIQAGRASDSVTLTVVSKTQTQEAVQEALDTGARVFGENRVQEAWQHWGERRDQMSDLELRLIGPLQTNKAIEAVKLFDVIETLDREKMAQALAQAVQKTGRNPRLLIQVNTGAEPQKAGVLFHEVESLLKKARDTYGLTIVGLMAIPPVDEDIRPHFEQLAKKAEELALPVLSMGMSSDFETAIACGATHVRVGSALFGERNRP